MTEKEEIKINVGKYKKIVKDISKNPWAVSTVVLAIVLLVVVITFFNPIRSSMNIIDKDTAGQSLLKFANDQGAEATLVKVNDIGSLYEVVLSMQGQEVPVYITKDGKNFTTSLIPLADLGPNANTDNDNQPSTPTNIPKSDKPVVEMFVMSHCPYGTQIEKGMLPVAGVLKDKIDFKIKFVYYAMHPTQGEVQEQLNQYCIQKEQKDKFLNYLTCFLEAGDGKGCLTKTSIDNAKLLACTKKTDEMYNVTKNLEDESSWLNGRFPLFNIDKADNEKYDVAGSPTLVINGVQVNSGRDSISLLNSICGAFNTKPAECDTKFETGQPSSGFGFGTAQASNNAAAGCVV